jgi:hypothetical protein
MILFPFSVPVEPDRPGARQLLADELAKQEYQRAKPSWFDLLLGAIRDWFDSLQFGSAEGPPAFGMLVLLIVIGVLLLIAFLVFGVPRLNRRSALSGSLFGEDDARTAAQMRAAAEAAAARGDYAVAIAEIYRAIARGLAERTVLTTSPGTTAHDFATRAARAFPSSASELTASASAFDDVRYLGGDGSREKYEMVTQLERTLRSAKPTALEAVGT